ncbi:hypothetical protein ISS05_04075 [Candidatus Woesearchaeota archaeon]|nr:hypothetical protein [Candidatus Woesearchaeota archaeon]
MSNNLKITPEIAEMCGIITGDGHLCRYISPKRTDYKIEISGDKKEEIAYFEYVSSLFDKIFNKPLKLIIEEEYSRLYTHSKEILEFFEKIGLIVGKKSDRAFIPNTLLHDKKLSLYFLRGLADTDFCVMFKKGNRKTHSYPKIVAEFASKRIIEDIQKILDRINITYYKQKVRKTNSFGQFTHYRLEINGKNNLNKWINLIGFSNPKQTTKIKVWEILGYCPPKTTYSQRIKILREMDKNPSPL